MKTYGVVEVQVHAFLTSALDEVSVQIHTPVGLRAGLDAVAKRKKDPFSAPGGNRTPYIQSVTSS
jgi:hypothetical protein